MTPLNALVSTKGRAPLKWFGAKTKLMPRLIPLMPHHRRYISVFGGSGGDIWAKPRSKVEVYNDINRNLYTFFHVLLDDRQRYRLCALVESAAQSRVLYADMLDICRHGHADDVMVAFAVYYCTSFGFGGLDPAICTPGNFTQSSRKGVSSKWLDASRHLRSVARRFRAVTIEHMDWQDLVTKYDALETLFYCDPPYEFSTRQSIGYRHEMSGADHIALLDVLNTVQGHVMLSGYDNALYQERLAQWRRVSFVVKCWCSTTKSERVECVWMNYDQQGKRLG